MKRIWHPLVVPFWALAIVCAWAENEQTTLAPTASAERRYLFDDPHFFAVSVVDRETQTYHFVRAEHVDTLLLKADARLFFHLRADGAASAGELLQRSGTTTSLASIPSDIDQLPVADKKSLFFSVLHPIVDFHNKTIIARRMRLQHIGDSAADRAFMQAMSEHYALARHGEALSTRSDSLRELLRRIDIIPPSLALAQGAIESGWGTSRFARRGNNLFGQRVWRKDLGGLQAQGATEARFRLAVYATISASVRSYMRNLNSHPAYAELRLLRAELRAELHAELHEQTRARSEVVAGDSLAAGLLRYSTRGEEYVRDVRRMIRGNKLGRLDQGSTGGQ
ncbi:MAG: Bax protein [Candidatus Latescibacterota bacterium]|jgi:Bax protein